MALAFQGDEEFIRKSINFAANFLLSKASNIKKQTSSFVIINTTMEELTAALETEGYLQKMAELLKAQPAVEFSDDDLPDNLEEQVNEYTIKMLKGEPCKDPTAALSVVETPEMVRAAKKHGAAYAKAEIEKIHFEDFMRRINPAGLTQHEFSENNA